MPNLTVPAKSEVEPAFMTSVLTFDTDTVARGALARACGLHEHDLCARTSEQPR